MEAVFQPRRVFHRRTHGVAAPAPASVPPVLIEASFDAETLVLTLGFDRALDLSALDPSQIVVDDGPGTGELYVGSGAATVLSPSSFTLGMMDAGSSGGMAVLLIAGSATGIVAVDDGGVWAGTGSGVVLPIPTPPPPANVIAAIATGYGCTLQFDRPVVLLSTSPDDAILFDGVAAIGVANYAADTLGFECPNFLSAGSTWEIVRQPAWVGTVVAQPVSGVLG
jgi:hypothetical protein